MHWLISAVRQLHGLWLFDYWSKPTVPNRLSSLFCSHFELFSACNSPIYKRNACIHNPRLQLCVLHATEDAWNIFFRSHPLQKSNPKVPFQRTFRRPIWAVLVVQQKLGHVPAQEKCKLQSGQRMRRSWVTQHLLSCGTRYCRICIATEFTQLR